MPGNSLYWSPSENDTDESSFQEKEPYIDPWDLENYAYIREHLESLELSSNPGAFSGSSGEFAEASQSFDYVPGKKRAGSAYVPNVREEPRFDSLLSDQGNYAAIEEIHQNEERDRKSRSETYYWSSRRFEECESDAEEVSPYAEGSAPENPVFGIYDKEGVFRRVALPMTLARSQKDRSMSFTYGDYEYDPCNSRPEMDSHQRNLSRRDSTLPIYDDVERNCGRKPTNFSLSKYGHLKIDYSCSWNNLNNYMKYN